MLFAVVIMFHSLEGNELNAASSQYDECERIDTPAESEFLEAVKIFADNVLTNGRDTYGEIHSPLFVDGISVVTGDPVLWDFYDGDTWILSNFASQQNLMRVLNGLTGITCDESYKKAAADAVQYMFDHQAGSNGLLYWGGHQFVDLYTMQNQFESRPHELKNHFPLYSFMWEVDEESTRQMLKAIWNAHILDWGVLDLNRHGSYNLEMGRLWDHDFKYPEPFFEGEGLTFINAGSDMIQVGMALYHLDGNENAKTWATRLYQQYVNARHSETGLGAYQYSKPKQRNSPPKEGPLEGELTYSSYGDRAKNQFSSEYGSIALEGNVMWGSRVRTIYGQSAVILLHIAEMLKGSTAGEDFLNWTLHGMKAIINHAYKPDSNSFLPMWADGKDLTGQVFPRTGYYGEKETEFSSVKPGGTMMISFTRAVRLTEGDEKIWNVVRHMFIDNDLGDPGNSAADEPSLNLNTTVSDPDILISVLELYKLTGEEPFIILAERIGNNILEERFHDGYFLPSEKHKYARFDVFEPLALLHLIASKHGKTHLVPPYLTGSGSTDGEKFVEGIDGRPTDQLIYEETID